MKKLRKQYQSKEHTLAAYITCPCNHLACSCSDIYGEGTENVSVTNKTFDQVTYQERIAWNN